MLQLQLQLYKLSQSCRYVRTPRPRPYYSRNCIPMDDEWTKLFSIFSTIFQTIVPTVLLTPQQHAVVRKGRAWQGITIVALCARVRDYALCRQEGGWDNLIVMGKKKGGGGNDIKNKRQLDVKQKWKLTPDLAGAFVNVRICGKQNNQNFEFLKKKNFLIFQIFEKIRTDNRLVFF